MVEVYCDKDVLFEDLCGCLVVLGFVWFSVIVIGVKGCVGIGVKDLLVVMGSFVIEWDMEEIVYGGLFFEIFVYDIFVNLIFVCEGMLVFVFNEVLVVLR